MLILEFRFSRFFVSVPSYEQSINVVVVNDKEKRNKRRITTEYGYEECI